MSDKKLLDLEPGVPHNMSEPEYVGVLPIRQEIELIPALSEEESKDIGWYMIPNGIKPQYGSNWATGPSYDLIRAKDYNEFVRNKDKPDKLLLITAMHSKSLKKSMDQNTRLYLAFWKIMVAP